MNLIKTRFPDLVSAYERIYANRSEWGEPIPDYYRSVHEVFQKNASLSRIPVRMPPFLYRDLLGKKDLVLVTLEHIDYILKLRQQKSPYGYAAHSLSRVNDPIEGLSREELLKLKGVGPVTVDLILEILRTGRCSYLEGLL